MYAVIKTGGKQYRVQPGDVLVVEKLDGEAGAEVSFDQVLALGDGGEMILGAPVIAGALVKATLVETRKGEKVKIFKKRRRQGYRRTKGHRQQESVLRVTSIAGEGKSADWDGEVDLTPLLILNARARGHKIGTEVGGVATSVNEATPAAVTSTATTSTAPAPAASFEGALVEQPISEVAPEGAETVADPAAQAGVGEQAGTEDAAAAPKKTRAKKAKPAEAQPSEDTLSEEGGEA